MKVIWFVYITVIIFCGCYSLAGRYTPAEHVVIIKPAVVDNSLTDLWKAALVTRMDKTEIDSFGNIKRPLTAEEQQWKDLFETRAAVWQGMRDSLAVPFPRAVMSNTIYVLTGFAGVDDAFTYESDHICFDLTAFNKNYGSASQPENTNRADRIFAHEYTHLLHKAWAARYRPVIKTFRDSVLWECIYEGMGMYRSLSSQWFPKNGVLPDTTKSALKILYPAFVKYISWVEKNPLPTAEQRKEILRNLSRGPVNKKWGAFTVGIWLSLESGGNDKKLIKWINQGGNAVILLAKKYLDKENLSQLNANLLHQD